MAGTARRIRLDGLAALAQLIGGMSSDEAIALGALRSDLPDDVQITTKDKLNGGGNVSNLIARSTDFIIYRPGEPAFALIDIDTKGMPSRVREQLAIGGGYGAALTAVLTALRDTGMVVRSSTSAGLYRTDTGERLRGSDGRHVYMEVIDGTDISRFLRTLHERCWLAGLGWMIVSRAGQLLERSLVDFSVSSPERPVFEGAPVLVPPLAQDSASRVPKVVNGPALDTRDACPDLTPVEKARLRDLKSAEEHRLAPELNEVRSRSIKEYAHRTKCTLAAARRIVERQHAGMLLPDVMLHFDDETLGKVRVAKVLVNPDQYVGETLADPLEGVEYGRCKAKIMQRTDGSLWIHSFAHGRTVYELKYDAQTIQDMLYTCNPAEVVDTLVRLLLLADVAPDEQHRLCEITCSLGTVKINPLKARIKAAKAWQSEERAKAERHRRAAARTDCRIQLPVPLYDAEWLPVMANINEVLGAATADEPPMRDIYGYITEVRVRRIPDMHALTMGDANHEEGDDAPLPPPERPLLTRLDEPAVAELIERYIEHDDEEGRAVHLPTTFVRHYRQREDGALPILSAVATLPIVLSDGTILGGMRGLDRRRGIVFRVPAELLAMLPTCAECTPDSVRLALQFLMDEWLVDVATDFTGKCILIAAALTLIERSILPERPVYFITAGRRGGGKTTTLMMLTIAVTGTRPAAAAWSDNTEERRKALLAYLLAGIPCIVWDNIERGARITCPHIERACTTAFYADRVLGVSETATAAASAIHLFTGNNIGPTGDLASRSLSVTLEVDRPDPENRTFVHSDPVAWSEAQRAKILTALYTILLGNPVLVMTGIAPRTRFKEWWRLVGSAVEHAARLHLVDLDFQNIFLAQEEQDGRDSASVGDALHILATKWPTGFKAADVAKLINDTGVWVPAEDCENAATLRAVLFPELATKRDEVSAPAVGNRLVNHVGNPVRFGTQVLTLKVDPKPPGRPDIANSYIVRVS
jgi:hypothetical protein